LTLIQCGDQGMAVVVRCGKSAASHGRRFSCVPIGRYPYRWLTYYLGGAERGGPFSVCVADGVAAGKPTECFNPNAAMICAEALSRKEAM